MVQLKNYTNENYYEMQATNFNDEEAVDLIVNIIASYATDIRKAKTIEEKEQILSSFRKCHFIKYFDDGCIDYIERKLKEEIKDEN